MSRHQRYHRVKRRHQYRVGLLDSWHTSLATLGFEATLEEEGRRSSNVLRWYLRHCRQHSPPKSPPSFCCFVQRELGIL